MLTQSDRRYFSCCARALRDCIKHNKYKKNRYATFIKSIIGIFTSITFGVVVVAIRKYFPEDDLTLTAVAAIIYLTIIILVFISDSILVFFSNTTKENHLVDFSDRAFKFDNEEYKLIYPDHANGIFDAIYDYDLKKFGSGDVTDIDIIKSLYVSEENNICALMHNDDIVAFFIFAFISRKAFSMLSDGRIKGINQINKNDFCKPEESYGIYIADIVATDNYNKSPFSEYIISMICNELMRIILSLDSNKFKGVVCRPVTDQGKRIAKGFCFDSLPKNKEIYFLDSSLLPSSWNDSFLKKEISNCEKKLEKRRKKAKF